MRLWRNALQVGKIAGLAAFRRTLWRGSIVALAAYLDELAALLQLYRRKLLKRTG
jgi:hypothetical protein